MKRSALILATIVLLVSTIPFSGRAAGPFEQKLSQEQQIIHALNRLTFGPRPGDVEAIRAMGVTKWIALQLHPDKIAENPELEEKLKPLETLRMDLPALAEQYTPVQLPPLIQNRNINTLLSQEEMRKVQIGTAEQRKAVLTSLDEEKRKQVLLQIPTANLDDLPEFKKQADEARKAQAEEVQKENRRRNPQLADLLTPDQVSAIRFGNKAQVTALLDGLDPDIRPLVIGALPAQALNAFPELRREGQKKRQPRQVVSQDLKEAKVFRALYSNHQLEEVLVDFWFNHFNVDQAKNIPQTQNQLHLVLGAYERDAIRPHVLGHFKDLLLATAHHPAMLYYLDNWQSMTPTGIDVGPFAPQRGNLNGVPNSILPTPFSRIAHGLNENYGREVMELHTLGVNGGYTQDDVIAMARCFTGWTVRDPADPEFVFASFMHDFGVKTLLGHTIPPGGGEQDGVQAIEILARHPSTAKFISRELAQRFVADNPPQSLVDRMAQTFTKTDGDLRAVLETMFGSSEFFSEGAWQAKVKSPFEMVISAVRATGSDVTDAFTLVQRIADLGQPLYNKLEPTGYPNTGDVWLSTAGVIGRMNFSTALASGQVPGVKPDASLLADKDGHAIERQLLGRDASMQTQSAIDAALQAKAQAPPFIASLVLGSPDFQRR